VFFFLMKTNAHNILCMQWLVMSNTNACIMSAPKEPYHSVIVAKQNEN